MEGSSINFPLSTGMNSRFDTMPNYTEAQASSQPLTSQSKPTLLPGWAAARIRIQKKGNNEFACAAMP